MIFNIQLIFPDHDTNKIYTLKELFLFIDGNFPIYKQYQPDIMSDKISVDLTNNIFIELLYLTNNNEEVIRYDLFLEKDHNNNNKLIAKSSSKIGFGQS